MSFPFELMDLLSQQKNNSLHNLLAIKDYLIKFISDKGCPLQSENSVSKKPLSYLEDEHSSHSSLSENKDLVFLTGDEFSSSLICPVDECVRNSHKVRQFLQNEYMIFKNNGIEIIMMLKVLSIYYDELNNELIHEEQRLLIENDRLRHNVNYAGDELNEKIELLEEEKEKYESLLFQQELFSLESDNISDIRTRCSTADDIDYNSIPSRLKYLKNLVYHYLEQKKYDIALDLSERALEDIKATHDSETTEDSAVIWCLISKIQRRMLHSSEAIDALKTALHIRRRCLPRNSLLTAATLNNLSVMSAQNGDYRESIKYGQTTLKMKDQCAAPDHHVFVTQKANLAYAYQMYNKQQKAEGMFRAVNCDLVRSNVDIDEHAVVQNNLAACLIQQKKYTDALNILRNIIDDYHNAKYDHCMDSILTIHNVAERYHKKKTKLFTHLRRYRVFAEPMYFSFYSSIFELVIANLAVAYRALRMARAEKVVNKWIAICKE